MNLIATDKEGHFAGSRLINTESGVTVAEVMCGTIAPEQIVLAVNAHDALVAALSDLIPLAEAAMRDANGDGAGYDIDAELSEARAALQLAKGGE